MVRNKNKSKNRKSLKDVTNNKKIVINIITRTNGAGGLSVDTNILKYILNRHFRKSVEIHIVDFFSYECGYADINFHLELVSNFFFEFGTLNILIPNQEWYYKTWVSLLSKFDYIFTKTDYASEIFKNLVSKIDNKPEIIKTGWMTPDLDVLSNTKKYNKKPLQFLHISGRSKYKNTQATIDCWSSIQWPENYEKPKLIVRYSPEFHDIKEVECDTIEYLREELSKKELHKLMSDSQVHICCSEAEGFGHYIQEAKASSSVILTTNGLPMKNNITEKSGILVNTTKKKKNKYTLGSIYNIDKNDLENKIKTICEMELHLLKDMGKSARNEYVENITNFKKTFPDILKNIFNNLNTMSINPRERMWKHLPTSELPSISIITPTYNRDKLFQLALHNFKHLNYPKDKLEWIIVEDSDNGRTVRDLLPERYVDDETIKYYYLDKKVPIGEKRNICCNYCSNEYIVCMDDDDYYYPDSILNRISKLVYTNRYRKKNNLPEFNCITCSTIACYHISRFISMINVPPHFQPYSQRISEASMLFKKSFWEQQKFLDSSKGMEAKEFIEGRFNEIMEIAWPYVFVSLLHNKNTSVKKTLGKPNGCHFGFSDELFLFLSDLDS